MKIFFNSNPFPIFVLQNDTEMIVKAKLPKKANCRVDYEKGFSYLVDYTDCKNEVIIFFLNSKRSFDELWGEFRYIIKTYNGDSPLSIDNYPFNFRYPFKKLPGISYQY